LYYITYGLERAAVKGAGAIFFKAGEVFFSAVTFVVGKSVAGIVAVHIYYKVVAVHLGDNRSAGDSKAVLVTVDDALLWDVYYSSFT
jgi:hypothetical protein